MNSETLRILDSIARDRNIDRELLFEDLEQAMISAARKHFNSLDTDEFGCRMDRENGEIQIWRHDENGEVEMIPLATMGRIPAQTAKQVMIQRFREDEKPEDEKLKSEKLKASVDKRVADRKGHFTDEKLAASFKDRVSAKKRKDEG